MAIGDKLKQQRERLGFSKTEMAQKLNVSRSKYHQWEIGGITPSLERVYSIVELCGVTFDYLLSDEEKTKPQRHLAPIEKEEKTSSYLKKTPKGWVCTAEQCAWRKNGYCPGTGCMKEFSERND